MSYRQSGVTLIEMMFVVLLIGLLALMVSPLGGSWINSARVNDSLSAMEQAVGQAKAAALRNPAAIQGADAASIICLNTDGVLSVRSAKPGVSPAAPTAATCGVDDPAPLWSTKLPAGVTIKMNDSTAWTCSCLTNKALLTNTGASCTGCGDSLEFTVSAGSGMGEDRDKRAFF